VTICEHERYCKHTFFDKKSNFFRLIENVNTNLCPGSNAVSDDNMAATVKASVKQP